MYCPKCNAKSKVRDVVHDDANQETYRQRTCPSCGHIFYTTEMEIENNGSFNKRWYRNHRLYTKDSKTGE